MALRSFDEIRGAPPGVIPPAGLLDVHISTGPAAVWTVVDARGVLVMRRMMRRGRRSYLCTMAVHLFPDHFFAFGLDWRFFCSYISVMGARNARPHRERKYTMRIEHLPNGLLRITGCGGMWATYTSTGARRGGSTCAPFDAAIADYLARRA